MYFLEEDNVCEREDEVRDEWYPSIRRNETRKKRNKTKEKKIKISRKVSTSSKER